MSILCQFCDNSVAILWQFCLICEHFDLKKESDRKNCSQSMTHICFKESDRYFASLECESEGDELEVGFKGGKSGCRTRSLSSDFKQYLANQGLQVPSDTSSLEVRCC